MTSPSYHGALRRLLVGGSSGEVVHYESVAGQTAPTLCGWDGGIRQRQEHDRPVDCNECLSIVRFFDAARKRRKD